VTESPPSPVSQPPRYRFFTRLITGENFRSSVRHRRQPRRTLTYAAAPVRRQHTQTPSLHERLMSFISPAMPGCSSFEARSPFSAARFRSRPISDVAVRGRSRTLTRGELAIDSSPLPFDRRCRAMSAAESLTLPFLKRSMPPAFRLIFSLHLISLPLRFIFILRHFLRM